MHARLVDDDMGVVPPMAPSPDMAADPPAEDEVPLPPPPMAPPIHDLAMGHTAMPPMAPVAAIPDVAEALTGFV